MLRIFLLAVIIVGSSAGYAEENKWRLGFDLGSGRISLGKNYLYEGSDEEETDTAYGLSLGYKYTQNILIELDYVSQDTFFGWGRNYDFRDAGLMLGYMIKDPKGDQVKLIPKVGISYWDLEARDDVWFSDIVYRRDDSGVAPKLGITLAVDFTSVFGMSLNYEALKTDFGKYTRRYLGFHFLF